MIQPDGDETELNTTFIKDWNFNYPAASWKHGLNLDSSFTCSAPAILRGDGLMKGEAILPGEKIAYVRFIRLDKTNSYEFKLWRKELKKDEQNGVLEEQQIINPKDYCTDPFSVLINFLEKTKIHVKYRSLYNKEQIDLEDIICKEIDRNIV